MFENFLELSFSAECYKISFNLVSCAEYCKNFSLLSVGNFSLTESAMLSVTNFFLKLSQSHTASLSMITSK